MVGKLSTRRDMKTNRTPATRKRHDVLQLWKARALREGLQTRKVKPSQSDARGR
jgi:hypothetical protein